VQKRIIIFIITPIIYAIFVNSVAALIGSTLYTGNIFLNIDSIKHIIQQVTEIGNYSFNNLQSVFVIIISSLLFGLIAALSSRSISDAALFISKSGAYFAFISITIKILQDINSWNSLDRFTKNIIMIQDIFVTLIIFNIGIVSAFIIQKIRETHQAFLEKKEHPKIITICECGAVYKSNPEICVVCGRKLRNYTNNEKIID